MFELLKILAVVLVSLAMALSVAHALELPGKMRLDKEHYLAVQAIYYPGFTFAGAAEPLGLIALLALLFFAKTIAGVWFLLAALVSLGAAHGWYWIMTHPVNNFWLKNVELPRAGNAFFGSDPLGRRKAGRRRTEVPWQALRDRWEWSHVVRAVLSSMSFILLVIGLSVGAL